MTIVKLASTRRRDRFQVLLDRFFFSHSAHHILLPFVCASTNALRFVISFLTFQMPNPQAAASQQKCPGSGWRRRAATPVTSAVFLLASRSFYFFLSNLLYRWSADNNFFYQYHSTNSHTSTVVMIKHISTFANVGEHTVQTQEGIAQYMTLTLLCTVSIFYRSIHHRK